MRTRSGSRYPPTGSTDQLSRVSSATPTPPPRGTMAAESLSTLIFTGPLSWTDEASCAGRTELFFAPAGERPEARAVREGKARAVCSEGEVLLACRDWAREHREYGFWGGEAEEDRAAAGFRVDIPVRGCAGYPRGAGQPAQPRPPGAPATPRSPAPREARSSQFGISARGRERSAGGGAANRRERRAPAGGVS